MPIYKYECEWCKNQQLEKHLMSKNPDIRCNKCGGVTERVITGGTGHIIKEGFGACSTKPDSYWDNAEKVRLEKQRKRKKDFSEKIRFGDKEVIRKLENEAVNAKNGGFQQKSDIINRTLDGKGRR
jgi:putative FmdB family regulatory protein